MVYTKIVQRCEGQYNHMSHEKRSNDVPMMIRGISGGLYIWRQWINTTGYSIINGFQKQICIHTLIMSNVGLSLGACIRRKPK